MRKCIIIINPESGKKKKLKNYNIFYDTLRKYGYDTEIIFTKRKGHATEIVQELDKNIDLVISAGGDGTLNEVVTGNMQRKHKLLIANLPLGTTNDVGNMYGYTKDIKSNLEILLEGKPKKIDVCYINDTAFVYVACLGDYIDMAYNTPRQLKKKYGKLAYILYGLKQLRPKIHSYNIKYKVNDREHEGKYSFFFITNSSRVAGVSDIYYDVKLDDNKFEVAFADVKNYRDLVKMFILMNVVDIKDIPGITYYKTNNLEIEFYDNPKTSWCVDGEEYTNPVHKYKFRVEKDMKMLMPRKNIKELFEEENVE